MVRSVRAGYRIITTTMRRARALFHFNTVAPAYAAGLDDSAQQAAPPANRFLKTLADFVHLVARRARLGNFEQSFAGAEPLPEKQFPERDPARRDVFPGPPRRDTEFLKRFVIHQQNLTSAPAPSVNTVLESLILNGKHFLEFAHGLAVRQALKYMQDFRHAAPPLRRAFGGFL
jgi:hypothetical protein